MLGHRLAGGCGFAGNAACFRAANQRAAAGRAALAVVAKESRIGKQIVPVPKSVQLTLTPELLKVKVRLRGGPAPGVRRMRAVAGLLRGASGAPGCERCQANVFCC